MTYVLFDFIKFGRTYNLDNILKFKDAFVQIKIE